MRPPPPSSFATFIMTSVLALACGSAAAQSMITNLGVLPGGSQTEAMALSGDGTTVVGKTRNSSASLRAFRWTSAGGIQDLGTIGATGSVATAVSADGAVVAGYAARAFRWTSAGGMQDLGSLGGPLSYGLGVSGDGLVVAGQADTSSPYHAFRWTSAGGMQDVDPDGTGSTAWNISADGSTLVGSYVMSEFDSTLRAFRWTAAGGMQELEMLPTGMAAYAFGANADGSVIVGRCDTETESVGFRWTAAGGMQSVGSLADLGFSSLQAVSADGTVAVGSSATVDEEHAVMWTAAQGLVDLNTYLPTLGVDLTGWTLTTCVGVNDAKTVFAGKGRFGAENRSWIIRPTVPPTFHGIAGLAGWTETHGRGISPDGSAVSGYGYDSASTGRAFRWTIAGGVQDIGTLGGTFAFGLGSSGDGLTVVGQSSTGSASRGFRWTSATGFTNLGTLAGGATSTAYGASVNGAVVVGSSGSTSGTRAYRWTTGGMTNLGVLSGGSTSVSYGVSSDGATVTGFSGSSSGNRAFRWVSGSSMVNLGVLAGASTSEGRAINADGSVIVGVSTGGPAGQVAIRWASPGPFVSLGTVPGDVLSGALAVDGTGALVGGWSYSSSDGNNAMLWNSALGMVDLNALLPALGVDLTGWQLEQTWAISADGTAATGDGRFNGSYRAWVVRGLPTLCAPLITLQPVDAAIGAWDDITFSAAAVGSVTSYQWRKGGVNLSDGVTGDGSTISGATTAALTITQARMSDSGSYDCVLTNTCGGATSAAAVLTVCAADYDLNGYVNGDDIDSFMYDFFYGFEAADVDHNEFVNGDDFDYFAERFYYGC